MATTAKIAGMKTRTRQGRENAQAAMPASQPLLPLRASRGFLRKFKLCRICFRKLALAGECPG
jgi:hypothetical protein